MAKDANRIILASASKSRQRILINAGVQFETKPSGFDETTGKKKLKTENPQKIAFELAVSKAKKVSFSHPDAYVIGADQVLFCDGKLMDKPAGHEGALSHLNFMSNKEHCLVSSVCVAQKGRVLWDFTDEATLKMRELSSEFIESYIKMNGNDILNTVGAYKIEGVGIQLFSKIEGDFFTILGLPLLPLLEFLRRKEFLKT